VVEATASERSALISEREVTVGRTVACAKSAGPSPVQGWPRPSDSAAEGNCQNGHHYQNPLHIHQAFNWSLIPL
jgi:hypothetical protein